MAKCELCGNDYDKTFELRKDGKTHVFDSFECAIAVVAPQCEHCGCKIVGHGAVTIFGHVEGELRASTVVIAEGAYPPGAPLQP